MPLVNILKAPENQETLYFLDSGKLPPETECVNLIKSTTTPFLECRIRIYPP